MEETEEKEETNNPEESIPSAEELVNQEIQQSQSSKPEKSKKSFYILLILAIIVIVMIYKPFSTGNVINNMENTQVKLTTNHGEIIIELYDDMPITTGNFQSLAEKGTYNGVIFHRIIPDFMIQGGDPTGTGFGDPSIPNIQDEFTHAEGNKNNRGTIAMANAGPNTGSSQFFINLVNNNFLDDKHPAFGEVIKGMDIVDKIAGVQTGANDKPVEDVIIEKAEIL